MDDADRAQSEIEREVERGVRNARSAQGPHPVGACLWCGLIVTGGRRWCDAECRDDWEHAHARAQR